MSRRWLWLLLPMTAATLFATASCSTTWPNRDPSGERLPQVTGTSLADERVTLPDVADGEPLLLLIGYVQDAQFDLDRWLLGLDQLGWSTRTFEVPTLPGMLPRMFRGFIDNGMRSGIPEEDWAAVVTVYQEAEKLAQFTGNERSRNGRILLLDGAGKVIFYHDRGYSVGSLKKLVAARAGLQ
ncbi:MAG: hypothetical protein VYA51_11605 [Planctomycetota bacterium]|nr:hypothetical protein [Planctomycetota bacterium]